MTREATILPSHRRLAFLDYHDGSFEMSLVRYGTNVFDVDDVDGLNLYTADDSHHLRIFLRGGEDSFEIRFDTAADAQQAFDTLCQELDVRDLTPAEPDDDSETASAI